MLLVMCAAAEQKNDFASASVSVCAITSHKTTNGCGFLTEHTRVFQTKDPMSVWARPVHTPRCPLYGLQHLSRLRSGAHPNNRNVGEASEKAGSCVKTLNKSEAEQVGSFRKP